MARRRRAPANPWLAWSQLYADGLRMWFDAAQVITARTALVARAGPRPGRRTQRELHTMVAEKAVAAVAGAQAATRAALQSPTDAARITAAALGPAKRRVRANARRLKP